MKVNNYVMIKNTPFGDGRGFGHQIGDIGVVRDVGSYGTVLVQVMHRESTSSKAPCIAYSKDDLELLEFQPGDIVQIISGGEGMAQFDIGKNLVVTTPESGKKYQSDCFKYDGRILCKFLNAPGLYETSSMGNNAESYEGWWVGIKSITKVCSAAEEDEWAILDEPEEDFSCLNDL